MKQLIADALAGELEGHMSAQDVERLIEVPPSEELGDLAFPCFSLARIFRKNPKLIAEELAAKLATAEGVAKVDAVSGYLNFFVDRQVLARRVLERATAQGYGRGTVAEKTVIEFSSPNSNKPLHLGHLRNMSIGESVSRLLEFRGNTVTRTCVNNDRGIHICQSMLAYQRYGDGATPESTGMKSDHFVGEYYVIFSKNAKEDPSLNDQARDMLRKWEGGDEATRKLWETMNKWAFEGFKKTYGLFGIRFDREYYESRLYTKGKEIVEDGLKRGIFHKRDDGVVAVDLTDEKLDEKVLLRSDGTAIYIVQDLYLAELKHREFDFDRSIYVVGNEQDYHFRVLVAILKRLEKPIADRIAHLSYGMVDLPEGKMKSREGTVVDADDFIGEVRALGREELKRRYELSDQELEDRSLKIALAAIKYQLLSVDITKNLLFDPKKAVSFEGNTGPYLLYSYARSSSILRKAESVGAGGEAARSEPDAYETRVLKKLSLFPETVRVACDKLAPSLVANYAFELSQVFNEFYHQCPVLRSEKREFRLLLVRAFRTVIGDCLHLLGIDTIEEM